MTWSRQNCMFITVRVTYNRGGDNITHTYAMRAYFLFYFMFFCKAKNSELVSQRDLPLVFVVRLTADFYMHQFTHQDITVEMKYFIVQSVAFLPIFFFFLSCKISKLIYHSRQSSLPCYTIIFVSQDNNEHIESRGSI